MSTPSLVLVIPPEGRVVIGPNKRYPFIVEAGNGSLLFGYVLDRDRGNAVEIEAEDVDLVRLLVRLLAFGIKRGLVTSPLRSRNVGIVRDEVEGVNACYTVNRGEPNVPLVEVGEEGYAFARITRRSVVHINAPTPALAAMAAVSAYIGRHAA